jgi:hypothetical protein
LIDGQSLRDETGADVTVVATVSHTESAWVKNLSIADLHAYYVVAGTAPVLVHNSNWCGPALSITGRQFGRKWGEHAKDFGLDVSDADARAAFMARIRDTYNKRRCEWNC